MKKIYFFQKRDILNGELMDEVIDCSERDAWNHYKSSRFFKYLGWSDGRFIKAVNVKRPAKNKDGISKQPLKSERTKLLEAYKQELEFAKSNPDKTPPTDLTKLDLSGKVIHDPQLLSALKALK